MDYFQLIPPELIEILISYLNSDSLDSFIQCYSFNSLNWFIIFKYHFEYNKNVNLIEYKKYLGIETLKDKLKLNESIEELSNKTELYLRNNQLDELPKEIGNLTSLQELYLGKNQLNIEVINNLRKLLPKLFITSIFNWFKINSK